MKWVAEQKVLIEIEAETEEKARNKIKINVMNCSNSDVTIKNQSQQSWIVPKNDYSKTRVALAKLARYSK